MDPPSAPRSTAARASSSLRQVSIASILSLPTKAGSEGGTEATRAKTLEEINAEKRKAESVNNDNGDTKEARGKPPSMLIHIPERACLPDLNDILKHTKSFGVTTCNGTAMRFVEELEDAEHMRALCDYLAERLPQCATFPFFYENIHSLGRAREDFEARLGIAHR
jgi:hypothetical protein